MVCIYCHSDQNVFKFYADKHYIEICQFCFEQVLNKIITCSRCGKILSYKRSEDNFILKNCQINKNGIICNDCLSQADSNDHSVNFVYRSQNLKEYFYKPTPKCRKLDDEPKNNIYMGIEL